MTTGKSSIEFESLVTLCGLEPDKKDWKIWRDKHGNSLRLSDKGPRVYMARNQDQTQTSDIFVKATPDRIAKHSYWVMLLLNDHYDATYFVGNDGRLRVSRFHRKKWMGNFAPLSVGIGALRAIINGYMNLDVRKVPIVPATFKPKQAWIGGYPDDAWGNRIECLLKSDMMR